MGTSPKNQGQASLLSADLLKFYRRVSQSLLTVVDVETTGALTHKARVIEVSVLQATLADGITNQTTHLINPMVKVPPFITKITGITREMVGAAAPPETVWSDCEAQINQGVLTAHNLDFDYGFLQAEYKRIGSRFYRPASHRFCTVLLSRLMLADLPSRSLPNLVKHYNFDVGPSHRAEADTKACWLLAQLLLSRIQQEPDEVLIELFGRQWIRLQGAAQILHCRQDQAQIQLQALEQRYSKRSGQPLYRRGDVEQIYYAQIGEQLSVFS
jgi:DNA polymerase-3 subunit epsilon